MEPNINNKELNEWIEIKSIELIKSNKNSDEKILEYKRLLENIIFEYHKICKELY